MFAKVGTATIAAIILIPLLIATSIQGAISAMFGGGSSSQPSTTALTDIPADYLTLYLQAATVCPGLDWSVLAAIGKIETDHGRSELLGVASGENAAGAGGVMQVLSSTWDGILARHRIPPGGTTPPSRYNPHDAIHAAAFYLCDNGAGRGDFRAAIFAYNHAGWYVDKVLAQAVLYRGQSVTGGLPNQAALVAVRYAQTQLGKPYVWSGDGGSDGGFDCSGLTHAAYAAAGITIPRTAQTQYNAGPLLPPGTPLGPGDLVFFSAIPGRITHVGIAISATDMINAPYTGAAIRVDPIGRYADASRPASQSPRSP